MKVFIPPPTEEAAESPCAWWGSQLSFRAPCHGQGASKGAGATRAQVCPGASVPAAGDGCRLFSTQHPSSDSAGSGRPRNLTGGPSPARFTLARRPVCFRNALLTTPSSSGLMGQKKKKKRRKMITRDDPLQQKGH